MAAVVDIGGLGATGLVGPVAVAAFAVPVEIVTGRDHEGHQMAFFRAFVVGAGAVDEIVGDGRGAHGGAGEGRVLGAGGEARLRERIGAVIGGIVVAVVVVLLLAGVIPPGGLVEGSAAAVLAVRPMGRAMFALLSGLAEAFDFFQQERGKILSQLAGESGMPRDEAFDVFVGGAMGKARPDQITVG